MKNITKILIVDDHAIARRGLEAILVAREEYQIVGYAASVQEAVTATKTHQPDLLLLDNFLADGMAKMVIDNIKAFNTAVKFLIVSGQKDDKSLYEAFLAGANGYVWKYAEEAEISQAIEIVSRGNSFFMADFVENIRNASVTSEQKPHALAGVFSALNERDIAIVRLVANGQTNTEIAQTLSLAEGTVRNYLSAMLVKTGANNRMQLAVWAIQCGIVQTPSMT